MKASGAISITPAVKVALDLGRRQDVIERIVQRTQVRIDLLAHVAGQEAEAFAGFDRWPRKYNAFHLPALEALGGVGNSKVGLARACGTQAEDEIDAIQSLDVEALGGRART